MNTELSKAPLGKNSDYVDQYMPALLFQISRQPKRTELGLTDQLPFQGVDYWNAYEISWLDPKGKPMIAIGEFSVPAESPCIFESKSLKLYLNSFNQTRLASMDEVQRLIQQDLSRVCEQAVEVNLVAPHHFGDFKMAELAGHCIDDLDVTIETYETTPALLGKQNQRVSETLVSHLLKSNCLVTHQPDWGCVQIDYTGPQIDRVGLLKYFTSFRQHHEFHEQCIERIFVDILQRCQPEKLSVYGRYTRRGGIDINPFRSNFSNLPANIRTARQ